VDDDTALALAADPPVWVPGLASDGKLGQQLDGAAPEHVRQPSRFLYEDEEILGTRVLSPQEMQVAQVQES